MSLPRWVGEALLQLAWRDGRDHVHCRSCSAALRPTAGESIKSLIVPIAAVMGGLAWASGVGLGLAPYLLVPIALVGGAVVHYPLARYELDGPAQPKALPVASMRK